MGTKVTVPETLERSAEVIADDIKAIAEGVRKLRAGRLNERALLLLVASASGVNQTICKDVLDGLATLDKRFLK